MFSHRRMHKAGPAKLSGGSREIRKRNSRTFRNSLPAGCGHQKLFLLPHRFPKTSSHFSRSIAFLQIQPLLYPLPLFENTREPLPKKGENHQISPHLRKDLLHPDIRIWSTAITDWTVKPNRLAQPPSSPSYILLSSTFLLPQPFDHSFRPPITFLLLHTSFDHLVPVTT